MRILSLIILMTSYFSALADYGSFKYQENPAVTYIGKYKEIAQSEMQRVGIPASIKLAQGILESNSGRSTLAQKANNHFGIKCGKYWEGSTFYREDDDYKDGKLIKSCFRKFNSPEHSYVAHSNFLTNPGSKYRYGFLFDLNRMDYVSWAEGLKSSGYATDPKYAEKLISVIEKFALYQYDDIQYTSVENDVIAAVITPVDQNPYQKTQDRSNFTLTIETESHLVRNGESMKTIADKYNIDLDLLFFQNRMPRGSQPKLGEKVIIQGIINWGEKRPKLEKSFSQSKESYLFEDGSMTLTIK
ncbi:MAG: glucosaminidase domain-containing protein [Saprospiraceae bacterium]|nr:glucosaminidase domain-containing protein [Saprospiraceae bacterium]